MKADDIRYALAKMVPDMARRVEFHTNYGPLWLFDQDAQRIAVLVERILLAQLKREDKHAQQRAAHKARQPKR
jgi:hypothetical protein